MRPWQEQVQYNLQIYRAPLFGRVESLRCHPIILTFIKGGQLFLPLLRYWRDNDSMKSCHETDPPIIEVVSWHSLEELVDFQLLYINRLS